MQEEGKRVGMNQKGWMFFDLLLKRYHPRDGRDIVALLTPEEQERCKVPASPSQLSDWLVSCVTVLSTLHPQWIVDALKTFEEKRRVSMLSALPETLCVHVCQLGKWKVPPSHVRPAFAHRILQDLLHALQDETYIPSSAVPKSAVSPLLDLNAEGLTQIIDGLGLRDLAEVVRGMIDKKFLHTIYSGLKPQEQRLLRGYVQQKERLKTPPLVLKAWDGKGDTLRAMYHERGLMRMAMALHGETPGFLWHLLHRLPPLEAKALQQKMHQRTPQGQVTALLTQQLLGVMEFFQRQAT